MNKRFYIVCSIILALTMGAAYIFTGGSEESETEQPAQSSPSEGIHL
jgi:hypothetical protein